MDYNWWSGILILGVCVGLMWVGLDTIFVYHRQQTLQQNQRLQTTVGDKRGKGYDWLNLPALLETDYFLGWLAFLFGVIGTLLMIWNLWTLF